MKRKLLVISVWLSLASGIGLIVYSANRLPAPAGVQIAYMVCASWLIAGLMWVKRIDDREWRQRIEQIRKRW